jgi:hypothetical protein
VAAAGESPPPPSKATRRVVSNASELLIFIFLPSIFLPVFPPVAGRILMTQVKADSHLLPFNPPD